MPSASGFDAVELEQAGTLAPSADIPEFDFKGVPPLAGGNGGSRYRVHEFREGKGRGGFFEAGLQHKNKKGARLSHRAPEFWTDVLACYVDSHQSAAR